MLVEEFVVENGKQDREGRGDARRCSLDGSGRLKTIILCTSHIHILDDDVKNTLVQSYHEIITTTTIKKNSKH